LSQKRQIFADFFGKNIFKIITLVVSSEKARLLENVGAKGAIVIDNNAGTSAASTPLFAMSGDGTDDVSRNRFLGRGL
jgi:hypothetical protein